VSCDACERAIANHHMYVSISSHDALLEAGFMSRVGEGYACVFHTVNTEGENERLLVRQSKRGGACVV